MPEFLDLSPLAPFGLDLDQYFGLWAMEQGRFVQAWQQVARMDLAAHVQTQLAREPNQRINESTNQPSEKPRIAVVSLEGVMTKRGSSLSGTLGTIAVRQQLRAAARSKEVDAILMRIDSPGGTVAGTAELGSDVARIRETKPIFAFIEDMGASAAYWVASQATRIIANDATADVGSIGTLIAFYDLSAAAAMQGVKPIVIKAGTMKGIGIEGTEITDAQKEYLQELVDAKQEEFTAAVARGRGLSVAKVQESVTGRVYMAREAIARGLVDEIAHFDAAVGQLAALVGSGKTSRTKGTSAMAQSPVQSPVSSVQSPELETASTLNAGRSTPTAASFEEIAIACDLDLENAGECKFACDCLSQAMTLGQSQMAWMKRQRAQLAEAQTAAQTAARQAAVSGVETIGTSAAKGEDGASDAAEAWDKAVAAELKAGAPNKTEAARRANRKHKELREHMLAAINS